MDLSELQSGQNLVDDGEWNPASVIDVVAEALGHENTGRASEDDFDLLGLDKEELTGEGDIAATTSLTAVVFGATGAVGRCIIGELLLMPEYAKIIAVSRRPLSLPEEFYEVNQTREQASGRFTEILSDYITLEDDLHELQDQHIDVVFCALGAPLKGKNRDPDRFRQVDMFLCAQVAVWAKSVGVDHYMLISSANASPTSLSVYRKSKAEAESHARSLNFAHLSIFRPDLIDRGDLATKKEKFFALFQWTVHARVVARAMAIHGLRVASGWAGGMVMTPSMMSKLANEPRASYPSRIPTAATTQVVE